VSFISLLVIIFQLFAFSQNIFYLIFLTESSTWLLLYTLKTNEKFTLFHMFVARFTYLYSRVLKEYLEK
jgi:hypothetical protein